MEKVDNDVQGQNRKRNSIDGPLCWNPVCKTKGKRHYISNFDISDKDTQTTLLQEYCNTKKARLYNARKGDSKVSRVLFPSSNSGSTVFRSSFGKGALESSLMAHQGADKKLFIDMPVQRNTAKATQYSSKTTPTNVDIQRCYWGSMFDM